MPYLPHKSVNVAAFLTHLGSSSEVRLTRFVSAEHVGIPRNYRHCLFMSKLFRPLFPSLILEWPDANQKTFQKASHPIWQAALCCPTSCRAIPSASSQKARHQPAK